MTSPRESIDSIVPLPPFIGEYSPPATDGVISDGRSSGEDVTDSASTSPLASSTRSQSSNSSTDRSDTSNEQALLPLVGNDGVQHRPFRIPRGENVNVAGHPSSDAEATSEEQTDGDPTSSVAMGAAAPDPIDIAEPDEPQIGENSDRDENTIIMINSRPRALSCPARLELRGEDRDSLLSSTSTSSGDDSEVEIGAESSVDEHRECPMMPENSREVTITKENIFDGLRTKGQSITPQINIPLHVGCQRQRDPYVYLDIIPCKDRHSRYVKIEGKLIISKSCSRYKWLVQYCKCFIVVTIFNPANNTELFSINQEYDIIEHCDSELNQDHQTDIKLDTLDHESIIYNLSDDITEYLFKVTVQLIEKGTDHVPFSYSMRLGDNDFTDVVLV